MHIISESPFSYHPNWNETTLTKQESNRGIELLESVCICPDMAQVGSLSPSLVYIQSILYGKIDMDSTPFQMQRKSVKQCPNSMIATSISKNVRG